MGIDTMAMAIAKASKVIATAACGGFVFCAVRHLDPLSADPPPPSARHGYGYLDNVHVYREHKLLRMVNLIFVLAISADLLKRLLL